MFCLPFRRDARTAGAIDNLDQKSQLVHLMNQRVFSWDRMHYSQWMAQDSAIPLSGRRRAVDDAYADLDRRLRTGQYRQGSRLPPERVLAQDIGVSRGTLRHALTRLTDDGRLERAPQSGWFVVDAPLGEPAHVLMSFTDMARQRGLTPITSILVHQRRPITLDEADRLRLAPGSEVLDLERLRSFDDVPICLDRSLIALPRCLGLDEVDLSNRSLYQAMEDLGTVPRRSDFAVQALPANEHQAEQLAVSVGSPVLAGSETCFGGDDVPLILGYSVFRGDTYRFNATLYR